MTKYLALGAGVAILLLLAAVGFLYWQGTKRDQRIGVLEESNKQLSETVKAKTNATQGRAQVDRNVRDLAPADVLDRLR
jgi:Tfp pilus assembly protein PilN